jgi:hypothetical protein
VRRAKGCAIVERGYMGMMWSCSRLGDAQRTVMSMKKNYVLNGICNFFKIKNIDRMISKDE